MAESKYVFIDPTSHVVRVEVRVRFSDGTHQDAVLLAPMEVAVRLTTADGSGGAFMVIAKDYHLEPRQKDASPQE